MRPGKMTLRDMTMLHADNMLARSGNHPEPAAPYPAERTMRRLAEPLQRDYGDLDPTSQPPPMDVAVLMAELQRQMEETKAAQTMEEQQGGEEHEMAEMEGEKMFLQSLLQTNPEVVFMALIEFLQSRQEA